MQLLSSSLFPLFLFFNTIDNNMYYSFDFAANVTHLCIDEIRKRGLQERKIFRKTSMCHDMEAMKQKANVHIW